MQVERFKVVRGKDENDKRKGIRVAKGKDKRGKIEREKKKGCDWPEEKNCKKRKKRVTR